MAVTASLINMKGGVGTTTLACNLSWYCAIRANLKVLAVDLDPRSNLSRYLMGLTRYSMYLKKNKSTVVDIFDQFSTIQNLQSSLFISLTDELFFNVKIQNSMGLLHLIPSRLELARILENSINKQELLSHFLRKFSNFYDLIIIDCASTESALTTAAYQASDYVFVPARPDFLSTIGLQLVKESLENFRLRNDNQTIEMGGIIFNGRYAGDRSAEQSRSHMELRKIASEYNWYIFQSQILFSESYPASSRQGTPIFETSRTKNDVKVEFRLVAEEFLKKIGLIK